MAELGAAHLTFHLKHEVLHLDMICRLFEWVDAAELVGWIDDEPTGQYVRKAGFLYEWMTGRELGVQAARAASPYVNVLDDRKLVAASPGRSVPHRRWRVRDNLLGVASVLPHGSKTRP